MSMELIQRLSSGFINTINDTIPGGGGGNIGPQVGLAPGQLGKIIELDDSELTPIVDTTMGQIFGGGFRYVQLAEGASAVVVGQIVFWNPFATSDDNEFVVTTLESGTVPGAQYPAGIVLNSDWEAGNYSFIQCWGPTDVKFRATLTQAPAGIGTAVFCAAVGAGVDNGFADCIATADPMTFSDGSLIANRYLGASIELPVNGGLTLVNLRRLNERG